VQLFLHQLGEVGQKIGQGPREARVLQVVKCHGIVPLARRRFHGCDRRGGRGPEGSFAGSPPPATALGRMSGCSVKPHNCPHSSAHQPLTQNPHPRRPTPRIVSYSITRSIRGAQIPIGRDQPPSSRFARFPPLEVFRRRPPCARHRPSAAGIRKPSQKETNGTAAKVMLVVSISAKVLS
jgi:hypothetical protein